MKVYNLDMKPTDIKQIRRKLKLTGDQLAEKLGVTGNTVRRWEIGVRNINSSAEILLRRIANQPASKRG